MTKHSINHLIKSQGTIINISSQLSIKPDIEVPIYCSSKAALNMFTKSMALKYAKDKVRINAICPGSTDTEMLSPFFKDRAEMDEWEKQLPLGRMADPSEMANIALFLASDEASYVTGSILISDGGQSL